MIGKKKQVVVVGNGMVGFRFCEKLLEYDALHQYQTTVLGEELTPAYDRVSLSSLFGGKPESELILAESRWYDYYKINLRLGARVVSVDRQDKTVSTASGKTFPYDHLVIATGSRPHVPSIPGAELAGVHVYRTPDDVADIVREAREASHAVVVGGGLLGLEAAEACRGLGLDTTIVERESYLMPCQLDRISGTLLDRKIEKLGIHLRLDAHVQSLEGEGRLEKVLLGNGETISADLVVIATGIIPNGELASDAGLKVEPNGGIAIGETTQTSDPDIFAIGECASLNGNAFGLVAPGYAMAEVAAARLGKMNKTLEVGTPAAKLKLLDLQVASIGDTHLTEDEACFFIDQDLKAGVYKKLLISKDWKKLLGAILVGETSESERLRKAVNEESPIPGNIRDLLAPIGQPLSAELEMDDDDVVCFCNYVTKGDICKAIDEKNLKTTSDVMGATYAAGLCGSCYDLVDSVTKQYVENGV